MPKNYLVECECGYTAKRYRNVKRCPDCGGLVKRRNSGEKCELYSDINEDEMVECGNPAEVKLIFLDDTIKAACPKCFYEQVTDGSAIGFFTSDGWRVDFAHNKPPNNAEASHGTTPGGKGKK